jgi:superfamily II DNA or RNA helicase
MNIPVLRTWQSAAIDVVEKSWKEDQASKVLIAACPGSGKTLMACVASINKLKDGDVSLVLVVSPTVNIKAQWKKEFEKIGVASFDSASNEAMRFRRDRNDRMVGGYEAICITYAQLAADSGLFEELARREKILLIADEVHHADDAEVYGVALEAVAEKASFKLALSGTPFNSSGGALAMCPSEEQINDEGRCVRKAKPAYSYAYSDALRDLACRPVEFIKVYGVGVSTYKSLANNQTFKKIVDLAKQNKSDSIGALLDPDGEFLPSMLQDGLKALGDIKKNDSRAAMLVVAKDKDHGGRIAKMINIHCRQNPDWRTYSVLEIYNDTDNAHARIAALENDRTDIIITVRMISEGVDVKRLRVGVYATDYRTRMFFVQFVGRFVRWETRLDGTQHGRVIIPAHIDLLIFAREIEQMIDDALIADESDGTSEPIEKKTELLGTQTERTNDGLIFSGKDEDDRSLAEYFFKMFPSLVGKIPEFLAIQGAKDANLKGGEHSSTGNQAQKTSDWWKLNEQLVRAVVKTMRLNGDDDDQAYRKVNFAANKHAGIPRVDKLTDVDKMKVRHAFLKSWLRSLRKNDGECIDGY